MRWSPTLAAAVLLVLAASESAAQHASARLAVRVAVVRSCAVQTGGNSPAQVTCSRGAGPAAVTTISPPRTPASAGDSVVNEGAPLPVTETATATMPFDAADAVPALAGVEASAEWPTEPGVRTPPAGPRPAYQIVTINF